MADQGFLDGLTTREVGPDIDSSQFKCGEGVDWFLKKVACSYHLKRISRVTCWMSGRELAGYIATSMSLMQLYTATQKEQLGLEKVKFHEQQKNEAKFFPAFLIGMLGVCERHQRKGLGSVMVKYAIGEARAISEAVGCRFVVVDSEKTDKALGLYKKNNFTIIEGQDAERETAWMYFDLGPR